MKILFIDNATDGHHANYLLYLTKDKQHQYVAVLPEEIAEFNGTTYICDIRKGNSRRSFRWYMAWLNRVYGIVKQEKPDVVHFLNADTFYRFFGVGLYKFKAYHSVATMHWVRDGAIQKLSLACICHAVKRLVVHSAYMADRVRESGSKNVVHIEYPVFGLEKEIDPVEAKKSWELKPDVPVIAAIGGTRDDKGLDLLLKALQAVKKPFQLLIAGKAETFGDNYIRLHSSSYSSSVTTALRYLSNEELENAIWGADIIVLPYKKIFTGASGPLTEGAWCRKCIVGPNHGNIGNTITRNHLGYTFVSEEVDDLAKTLNEALSKTFTPDEVYLEYTKSLQPELFTERYIQLYEDVVADRS